MTGQIRLLCYPSCRDVVKDLFNRLKLGGRDVLVDTLASGTALSSDRIKPDVSLNVLVVRKEDLSSLSSDEWNEFPRYVTIKKDSSLSVAFCIDCDEIPYFLAECFLVKKTGNSTEEIWREIVQIHSHVFQLSKGRYGFFVGRNRDIEQFQNLLYSEKASRINALVVSGRPGVGREAYVRECIRQEKGEDNYEPFILSMGKNGSIELFLVQLNSIRHFYTEEKLISVLGSSIEEKVTVAVQMLNELYSGNNYVLLYDDGAACVLYNRGLSGWFKSVATHPMLKGGIHLYVISNISVSYSRVMAEDSLAFITLYGLTLSDRKKLLYKRSSELSIALTEEQVAFIADTLVYSPSQLMNIIEDLKNKKISNIRDVISNYQTVSDRKILSLVNSYSPQDYPDAKDILVMLSKIEYVSEKILYSVFSDRKQETEKTIDRFMSDGIVERFGEWMDLMRLDSSISDYIRRNKFDYSEPGLDDLVIDVLDKMLDNTPLITEDYASYLYKLKKGVQRGQIDKESFLVPSVLVNTIAESYDAKQWDATIEICEGIMDSHTDYFEEIYREINYWYCLALARNKKGEKFFQAVKYFTGADLHFLKGFYFRIGKQFAKAEEELKKAMTINPSLARARREMVIVLQAQHKFKDALDMAELNYEKDPENAYHVHAYFRCLVRKHGITPDERNLLWEFKEDPNNLFKSKYYLEGMDFEYKRFIDRVKPEVLLLLAKRLETKYKDVIYIKDITEDYYVSQGFKSHLVPVDYSDDFDF